MPESRMSGYAGCTHATSEMRSSRLGEPSDPVAKLLNFDCRPLGILYPMAAGPVFLVVHDRGDHT